MWLIPTHSRPGGCARTLASLIDNGCSTPGIILLNGLDKLFEYDEVVKEHLPYGWIDKRFDMNMGVCGAMRWLFSVYPNEPFYGFIADDETVHTPGWDKILIEAAGTSCLAHGNNGDTSKDKPHGFMVMGGDLVRSVGWWAPPDLWHWYFDAFWEVIAKRCDVLRFCQDVKIEERHHWRGTAPYDETYRLGESRKDEDQAVFEAWLRDGMLATCERVKHADNRSK